MPPDIRTPDQRLRVFVSSTLAELADERAAVARAVTALRLTPVMFEIGARPHPPRDLYRSYLAQSDIFVGLYWQRYGWVAPDMEISGLEDELVLSAGMPRLMYIKQPAPDREPRLTEMLHRLEEEGTASYRAFRSPRELGTLVRDDLAVLLSERFTASAPTDGPTTTRVATETVDAAVDGGLEGGAAADAAGTGVAQPTERAAAPRRPRSLPVETTSLVGREADIEAVAELLSAPDVRLVTLTGPGGIGKTRLAVAVGERLDGRYPAGAVFVPLASITDPSLVLPRLADAVGAPHEGTRPVLDVLVEHLGDTPTLVTLDNLEQVVGVAGDLDQMLTRCPGLQILATSRTVLRLRGEHDHPVQPLSLPREPDEDDVPAPEDVAAFPAVRLLVERARAVRPDFAVTDDNVNALVAICRSLDGLPLAIELAAARIRLLTPSALAARLADSLDVLGRGPVDLPERQRTLRATIDWSIGLLDDDERSMLATLSVFVDGWRLEAATEVAGIDEADAIDVLDRLVGHSLVATSPTGQESRFRLLEPVRERAAELRHTLTGLVDVEERHAAHFHRLVETASWLGSHGAPADVWAAHLVPEEGNLRATIAWGLDHDVAPLPHLFFLLWPFWQMRDHIVEARRWVDQLTAHVEAFDQRSRLETVLLATMLAIETGDDATAIANADEIRRLRQQVDDPLLGSIADQIVSWVLPITDDIDGSLALAESSLDEFRRLEEPYWIATALMELGMVEVVAGRLDTARAHLREVHALGREAESPWFTGGSLLQLAVIELEEGRPDEARRLLHRAFAVESDSAVITHNLTFGLVAYARLQLVEGDAAEAARAMAAAEALRRRAGLRVWPSQRRGEDALVAQLEDILDPVTLDDSSTAGRRLTRRQAVDLLRTGTT